MQHKEAADVLTVLHAQALRTAQKNIKLAREEVEEMLGHLDTARQVINITIPVLLTWLAFHHSFLISFQHLLEGVTWRGLADTVLLCRASNVFGVED